jgi:hypothetical protein
MLPPHRGSLRADFARQIMKHRHRAARSTASLACHHLTTFARRTERNNPLDDEQQRLLALSCRCGQANR